jgi:protein-disulfide isomerase
MTRALVAAAGVAAFGAALWAAVWALRPFAPPPEYRALAGLPGFRIVEGGGLGTGAALLASPMPPDATPTPPLEAAALCAALFDDAAQPGLGPVDAPVRIAVFTDVRCPTCRTLDPALADLASEGAARVTWRHWPVFGPDSETGARAALAAAALGGEAAHAALVSRMMRSAFAPNAAWLAVIAPSAGLAPERLAATMASPEVDAALGRTAALAATFGFVGTPALVIGRTVMQGAPAEATLRALVAAERAEPGPPPCGA